ncbi:MAG: hypothetical protein DHS20C01_35290 [marine bacterium B5-7]|nr:MAG: hypothetical protein DHS20C01_35290 [marine bacterium B5-7]
MAERRVLLEGQPYYYQIHLYMPCNLRCIMCVPSGKHPKDFVSLEDFERFFDGIKHHAERITLIGGETLLYPWINEVLDLLAQYPIGVTIITNATMLGDALCKRLTRLHDLELKCSIDGATADTFHKIRGADVFDKVTENVQRFAHYATGKPNIKQIMCYVVMRRNFHEVFDFVDYCRPLNPYRIEFHPVRHVGAWVVDNKTGWTFDGKEQSCESFQQEFNDVMSELDSECEAIGLECETFRI